MTTQGPFAFPTTVPAVPNLVTPAIPPVHPKYGQAQPINDAAQLELNGFRINTCWMFNAQGKNPSFDPTNFGLWSRIPEEKDPYDPTGNRYAVLFNTIT